MKSIHGNQIRAARGLLNWQQSDLARESDVGLNTIAKLESGSTERPNAKTLAAIVNAFMREGVAFTPNGGVEPVRPEFRTYQGIQGVQEFFDDVYETLREQGGEVVITGFDEDLITAGPEFRAHHLARMSALKNYTMRCLIKEGDTNFVASDYCAYKWTSNSEFQPVPFYAYGDKIAFIQYDVPIDAPMIAIIHSGSIANAFRKHFEAMWRAAKEPT